MRELTSALPKLSWLMLATSLCVGCGADRPADSPDGSADGGSAQGGSAGVNQGGSAGSAQAGSAGSAQGGSGGGPAQPGVVGYSGIAAWDALSAGQRSEVQSFSSFFLHQSVGGDLEDGAEAGGFKFEWVASGATELDPGLNGGLFSSSNGNPSGKIAEWRGMALGLQGKARVAILKFGYADIVEGKAAGAQAEYAAAVTAIKAASIRVLHVTPPLVYNVPAENAPKQAMRDWMIATYPGDVIFDLQDAESTEPGSGTRCERGGSWEICDSVRSTAGCPSKEQGIDSASGQGHLCFQPHAQQIAKAFLYAIYLAGK